MNRDAVLQSLAELRQQLERHEQLIQGEVPAAAHGTGTCRSGACGHQQRLCRFLLEAADILDSTRKAFKSRQLEALRKECLRILAEEMGEGRPGPFREPARGVNAEGRHSIV